MIKTNNLEVYKMLTNNNIIYKALTNNIIVYGCSSDGPTPPTPPEPLIEPDDGIYYQAVYSSYGEKGWYSNITGWWNFGNYQNDYYCCNIGPYSNHYIKYESDIFATAITNGTVEVLAAYIPDYNDVGNYEEYHDKHIKGGIYVYDSDDNLVQVVTKQIHNIYDYYFTQAEAEADPDIQNLFNSCIKDGETIWVPGIFIESMSYSIQNGHRYSNVFTGINVPAGGKIKFKMVTAEDGSPSMSLYHKVTMNNEDTFGMGYITTIDRIEKIETPDEGIMMYCDNSTAKIGTNYSAIQYFMIDGNQIPRDYGSKWSDGVFLPFRNIAYTLMDGDNNFYVTYNNDKEGHVTEVHTIINVNLDANNYWNDVTIERDETDPNIILFNGYSNNQELVVSVNGGNIIDRETRNMTGTGSPWNWFITYKLQIIDDYMGLYYYTNRYREIQTGYLKAIDIENLYHPEEVYIDTTNMFSMNYNDYHTTVDGRPIKYTKFIASENGQYKIYFTDDEYTAKDTVMYFYDHIGGIIAYDDDSHGGADPELNLVLDPGIYYIAIGPISAYDESAYTVEGEIHIIKN